MKKILKKIFCLHYWIKTDGYLGDRLIEWKCIKCDKKTYKNHFDIPISYYN
jgi:hypothetical protein